MVKKHSVGIIFHQFVFHLHEEIDEEKQFGHLKVVDKTLFEVFLTGFIRVAKKSVMSCNELVFSNFLFFFLGFLTSSNVFLFFDLRFAGFLVFGFVFLLGFSPSLMLSDDLRLLDILLKKHFWFSFFLSH